MYWANQAKADLEKAHPGQVQVIVKTAANAGGLPEEDEDDDYEEDYDYGDPDY